MKNIQSQPSLMSDLSLSNSTIPPSQLKLTQEWFASIITAQMAKGNKIKSRSPHGYLIAEESARYVVPSPTLQPHERMQIYNQQYWWRLLNLLHDNFPLVARLFGRSAFNEKISIPYLLKYPPNHWSINLLGKRLPKWIEESYQDRDRSLVLNASLLDWAFLASIVTKEYPPLNISEIIKEDPNKLVTTPFYLQPHIAFFSWEYDLFSFRKNCLKESIDYWLEHRFPLLPKGKTYYFILFRNASYNLSWKELTLGEYVLLQRFKQGSSMNEACEFIETQDPKIYSEVTENLEKWLQQWTQAGWLTMMPNEETEYELET